MNKVKVIKVDSESIEFDNGVNLSSAHSQDCCENHYLSFGDVKLEDFDGLWFDLTKYDFFNRIDGYGIELVPIHGHSVKVPGYGYNNGYYSSDLSFELYENNVCLKRFDISDCQVISD